MFRRRKYVIKKGLQFRYIGIIFALALLTAIVTGYTVFATGWTLLGERLADVYPQGMLLHAFRTTNLTLVKNLLLISPLIFILGLLFSHKIAGPLYRIERTIDDIAKGNLALKIKLRKGDELSSLADAINSMTENFNTDVNLTKDIVLKIKKDLDGIRSLVPNQDSDSTKMEASINNLETQIDELSSSLSKWTTTS